MTAWRIYKHLLCPNILTLKKQIFWDSQQEAGNCHECFLPMLKMFRLKRKGGAFPSEDMIFLKCTIPFFVSFYGFPARQVVIDYFHQNEQCTLSGVLCIENCIIILVKYKMKHVTYLPKSDWFIWLQIFLEAFVSGKRFLAYVSVAGVLGVETDLVTVVCWETGVGAKIFSGTIALGCLVGRFSTWWLEMVPSWGVLGRLGIVCWFSLFVLDSKSVSSFLLSLEREVSVILRFFII